MTLKTLVTGIAAAAAISGAAMGVTSIASPAIADADCRRRPHAPRRARQPRQPERRFSPGKAGLVEGGIGPIEGRTADRLLKNAYATGALPVTFKVLPPVCKRHHRDGDGHGRRPSQPITFVDEAGWKLSMDSATAVLAAFGG